MNAAIKIELAEQLIIQFKHLYQALNASSCEGPLIDTLYAEDMVFEDIFHRIEGRSDFKAYLASLYENVVTCSFEFHEQWVNEGDAMLTWTMTLSHSRINKGQPIQVEGVTKLFFDNKITFHRDYFDGGALLYEHLPIMGSLIKQIKKRMV